MCQLMRDVYALEDAAPMITPGRYKEVSGGVGYFIRYCPANRMIYEFNVNPSGSYLTKLWTLGFEYLGTHDGDYDPGAGFILQHAGFAGDEIILLYQKSYYLVAPVTLKLVALDLVGNLQREIVLFEDATHGMPQDYLGLAGANSDTYAYVLFDDYTIKVYSLEDGGEEATISPTANEAYHSIAYTGDHLYVHSGPYNPEFHEVSAKIRSYTPLGVEANTESETFSEADGNNESHMFSTDDYIVLAVVDHTDLYYYVYDDGLVQQYVSPEITALYSGKVPQYLATLVYHTHHENTLIANIDLGAAEGFQEWRVGPTEWYSYELETKASIGTNPALGALNNKGLSAEIVYSIRRAIERLAPAYENATSGKPWNMYAADPVVPAEDPTPPAQTNNLLYQAMPDAALADYGVVVDDPFYPTGEWDRRKSWTRRHVAEGHVVKSAGIAYICMNAHFSTEDNWPVPGSTYWAIYKGKFANVAPHWKKGYYYRPARDLVQHNGSNWISRQATNHYLAGVEGVEAYVTPGTNARYWSPYFSEMYDGSPDGRGTVLTDEEWSETLDPKGGPYPTDIDFGEMRLCIDRLQDSAVFE